MWFVRKLEQFANKGTEIVDNGQFGESARKAHKAHTCGQGMKIMNANLDGAQIIPGDRAAVVQQNV